MNAAEIVQKAIECGHSFETMCNSQECETDEAYNTICHCEYNEVANVAPCALFYGYEHGFADGVEEGKKVALADLDEHDKEVRRKFAEWFAKCSKVSEPILEHTVNRWIEDYEKERK